MVYLGYADSISAFGRINCIEDDVDGFVKIAIIDLSRHLGFKIFKLNNFSWTNKIQIRFLKFVENCPFDSKISFFFSFGSLFGFCRHREFPHQILKG
jgi:hypothetical protein